MLKKGDFSPIDKYFLLFLSLSKKLAKDKSTQVNSFDSFIFIF